MIDLPEALEQLTSRVNALEKRVHQLEHPSEAPAPFAENVAVTLSAGQATAELSIEHASGMFPVLGRAMLGIAGAYLLRAVAELGPIPRQIIAAAAIAYAVAWLVWAAKARSTTSFTRAIYAGTSAVILMPMLWELTLRFGILPPAFTATVLGAYVVTGTALAWKRDLTPVFWIAHGSAAIAALALSITTREMVPFLCALLLMVLVCECAAARGHGQSIRPFVYLVADAAVSAQIFIYSGPAAARTDYPLLRLSALLAPACLIFLLSVASITNRSALLKQRISSFDVIQAATAFLLVALSVSLFAPHSGAMLLGIVCLLLSAAGYWATFAIFHSTDERRNFRVFATWSMLLFLAGIFWSLPLAWATVGLCIAALATILVASSMENATLELHGLVYLVAAAVGSGIPAYVFHTLSGPLLFRTSWSTLVVAACTVLCYAASVERAGESRKLQLLHFLTALLASCAFAAIIAEGILRIATLVIVLDPFHVAFLRTLALCGAALALAFGGSRWKRAQLTRIAYGALAVEATKLIFEDLRQGRMEFIAASFFIFAVTLIGVPRLARMGHRAESKSSNKRTNQQKADGAKLTTYQ
jgi:hypothetical protein